jgi:hypothetical protein
MQEGACPLCRGNKRVGWHEEHLSDALEHAQEGLRPLPDLPQMRKIKIVSVEVESTTKEALT